MINATVTGNLGRDPELKDTKTGKKMTSFSVASTTKRDGRDPETTWIDVVCFDEVAEGAAGTFRKGMKVLMSGQMSLETYQRKDGTEGTALRMVANDIGLSVRTPKERDEERRESRPVQKTSSRNEPW